MQNPIGIVFMVIFTIVTVFVYLAVRRGYLGLTPAAVIGGVGSSLSFFFYSLSQDNPFNQAIIVGVGLGLVFTGLTVGSAAYFRANSQPPRPETADVPPAKATTRRLIRVVGAPIGGRAAGVTIKDSCKP